MSLSVPVHAWNVPSAWQPAPTHDQCIYCASTLNVYVGRCEDCAVAEYDNEMSASTRLVVRAWGEGLAGYVRRCFCPDDCNCQYPWRPNLCGCAGHDLAVQS